MTTDACGPVDFARWNLVPAVAGRSTFVLSPVVRTKLGPVGPDDVDDEMSTDPAALTRLLPPFAAVRAGDDAVTMVADSMGFRPLYHSASEDSGGGVLSTSAILAGRAISGVLDETAVAVQSQLGWQLGQRTLLSGISKLTPGSVARLDGRGVHLSHTPRDSPPDLPLDEAVARAVQLLRTSLESLLDDHPDAVLQLTGGQDSRLLLSAIPVARRRGLRAMTLDVPGSGDVAVATALAARYGLRHEVHALAELDSLSPVDAWALCRAAASRLDGTADPIAQAALGLAERQLEQGVRISGLGGEVARGFYYVGRVRDRPLTRKASDQLAAWRMFANESVERDALDPAFAAWAHDTAESALFDAMAAGGKEWFRATDHLYLVDRMQRWAGVTDVAEEYERRVINPMLDEEFLTIARRLAPANKANSLFLARLQMELDAELGGVPLEGRPAPIAYAHPDAWTSFGRTMSLGRRGLKKVTQRMRGGNRAPAGGVLLAQRVVEHWRNHPAILESSSLRGFVRREWAGEVLSGRSEPRPSTVAFVTSLLAAVEPAENWVSAN